jgi:hypothetical protein
MARYIDADVLREKMNSLYRYHLKKSNYSADGAVADCLNFLDDTPTADVVPTSELDRVMQEKTALECIVGTARNQARADTVKKMQDVVKSKMVTNVLGIKFILLYEEELDQIAKEILEGGDTE